MKIAILLAGQVRDWNACSKIFELYNSIYSDVEFNFFLATWDDKYDNVEYDMNSYSFITEYKFHDQKESLYTEQLECYAYLCKSANILKNKYAKKHSIKYDCVIATRPDIFLGLDLLSNIRDLLVRSNNYEKGDKFILNKNVVYTPTGTLPYRKTNKDGEAIECFYMDDLFVVGSNFSIDKFSDLYDNISEYKINDRVIGHATCATYIVDQKLANCRIEGYSQIIRNVHVDYILDLFKRNKLQDIYDNSTDFNIDFEKKFRILKSTFNKSMIKIINPYINETDRN
jgi:hypothetical protein|tara:strand:+ start:2269 stop:3123 length:855 start_codon:yes stop_codon:yes gene_type:complete